jgi:predicted nucleotidyltransferase
MSQKEIIIQKLSSFDMKKKFLSSGISHISLFWSFARWENNPESDLDLLYELSPQSNTTLWDLQELEEFIIDSLDVSRVDFVSKKRLNPQLSSYIQKDLIQIF